MNHLHINQAGVFVMRCFALVAALIAFTACFTRPTTANAQGLDPHLVHQSAAADIIFVEPTTPLPPGAVAGPRVTYGGYTVTKSAPDQACILLGAFGPTDFLHFFYVPLENRVTLVVETGSPRPAQQPIQMQLLFDGKLVYDATGMTVDGGAAVNLESLDFLEEFEGAERLEVQVDQVTVARFILSGKATDQASAALSQCALDLVLGD